MLSPYENRECPARTLPCFDELSVSVCDDGIVGVLSCLESFHVLKNLFLVKRIYECENYADDDIQNGRNHGCDIVNAVVDRLRLLGIRLYAR